VQKAEHASINRDALQADVQSTFSLSYEALVGTSTGTVPGNGWAAAAEGQHGPEFQREEVNEESAEIVGTWELNSWDRNIHPDEARKRGAWPTWKRLRVADRLHRKDTAAECSAQMHRRQNLLRCDI
jgi:hypothetical protein